ncbi:MAG TPA: hypothetical protein VFO70_03430 [Chitinophagaceae bacterium]|nr:hypothetical protein [Chitinophagaceae bacterium]
MLRKLLLGNWLLITCLIAGAEPIIVPKSCEDSASSRILIINSFDAMALKVRKNKRELFRDLADTLKIFLARQIQTHLEMEPVLEPGIVSQDGQSDSLALEIMKRKNLATLIIIKDLDVYFDQTDVEVEKEGGTKTRTASYDICSKITYAIYRDTVKIGERPFLRCSYFTKRKVASGLLAAGPDVVGKSKHVIKEVEKNAAEWVWVSRSMLTAR